MSPISHQYFIPLHSEQAVSIESLQCHHHSWHLQYALSEIHLLGFNIPLGEHIHKIKFLPGKWLRLPLVSQCITNSHICAPDVSSEAIAFLTLFA